MTTSEKARNRRYYIANRDNILAKQRAHREANPEKYRAYRKQYLLDHPQRGGHPREPERSRARELRYRIAHREELRIRGRARRYGLSHEEFQRLVTAQANRCGICGKDFVGTIGSDSLNIDHDHATKAIRGLICGDCNIGLGRFKDNPETLLAAISYLTGPPLRVIAG